MKRRCPEFVCHFGAPANEGAGPGTGYGYPVWRASVENAHTGERRAFANLAELFEFCIGW